jgi:hypothetical protein
MEMFEVGEDLTHCKGDRCCPACAAQFPEPCRCGGLVHASAGADEDPDGNR